MSIRKLATAVPVAASLALGGCVTTGPGGVPVQVSFAQILAQIETIAQGAAIAACQWEPTASTIANIVLSGVNKGQLPSDLAAIQALANQAASAFCQGVKTSPVAQAATARHFFRRAATPNTYVKIGQVRVGTGRKVVDLVGRPVPAANTGFRLPFLGPR